MKVHNKQTGIKAYIFDLDGTILDSSDLWINVDKAYLKRYGIAFKEEYSDDIKSLSFNESARYFIERFNIPRSEEEIKRDWNEMVEYEYSHTLLAKEGVRAFLQSLKTQGIHMCVATSCTKEHAIMALQRLKLLDYFSFIRTTNEAGRNKESPDLFNQCASMLDCSSEECVVVEDLYCALKVAHEAGFVTIAIEDRLNCKQRKEIELVSDYYIGSFLELL